MIDYLRIKNHKALKYAQMMSLGKINVICGKNNSGKTTILEALNSNKCYGIGKRLEPNDTEWLVELFSKQANRYSNPEPQKSMNWFREYIKGLTQKETIWFSDAKSEIIQELVESKSQDHYLSRYSIDIFEFEQVLNDYFEKSVEFYTPILIPPKREIEFQVDIALNQEISPLGKGIINKLFLLKNQDLDSGDYTVYKNIYDNFYEITGSKFNVIPDKNNQIKLYYRTDENWIPASASGLGLSDVLIMVSIINLVSGNVFLLEEPENHLHAAYQKRFLKYIHSLKGKQFFITTHSSVFLDGNIVDRIFYCSNNGQILLSDQTSKSKIIDSLGYSVTENLVADVLILLEGPTDIPVIQEMLNWVGINSYYNIKFWPLGGDIMASLDLSVFADRNNVFALVDSDPGSSGQRTRFGNKCKENGVFFKKLERYSIENYFPLEAIKKVFPDQIIDTSQKISSKKSVDTQIGLSIKSKNGEIVKNMKVSDIEGTDLYEFLLSIKSFLVKNDENK